MCWEAGRWMYHKEQQFMVVLCDMQQQPDVPPQLWQIWGPKGASNLPGWEWDACAGLHPH